MPDHVTPNDVAQMAAGEQTPDNMQEERSEGREFTPSASRGRVRWFYVVAGLPRFFRAFSWLHFGYIWCIVEPFCALSRPLKRLP